MARPAKSRVQKSATSRERQTRSRERQTKSRERQTKSREQSIEKLRLSLLERRRRLRQLVSGEWDSLGHAPVSPAGNPIDAAFHTAADEINGRLIDAENRELRAVEAALARWETGDFGVCESCGRDIPLTRLRAVPYASDCIGCRRRHEQFDAGGIRLAYSDTAA